GTHRCDQRIVLSHGVTVEGAGAATMLTGTATTPFGGFLVFSANGTLTTFRDFALDAPIQVAAHGSRVAIDSVSIVGAPGNGLEISPDAADSNEGAVASITHYTFDGVGHGLVFGGGDVTVDSSTFRNADVGISVDPTPAELDTVAPLTMTVTNTTFEHCATG